MLAGRARVLHVITKRQQLHDHRARARPLVTTPLSYTTVTIPRDLLTGIGQTPHPEIYYT